jgi:hypothetical protein
MTTESRATNRRPTNRAGIIKVDGKELTVVLRDSSEAGACVRPVGSWTMPERFRLVAPMEKIDADCVVIWRRGRDCGVKFD